MPRSDDLLTAVEGAFGKSEYTVIVTADHGGHGNDHGSADPRDVLIPWVTWGRAVKPGHLQSTGIRTMDTAATVAWLLGLDKPENWVGDAGSGRVHGGHTCRRHNDASARPIGCSSRHPSCRALTGSTRVARIAGNWPATSAATPSESVTPTYVMASVDATPNRT